MGARGRISCGRDILVDRVCRNGYDGAVACFRQEPEAKILTQLPSLRGVEHPVKTESGGFLPGFLVLVGLVSDEGVPGVADRAYRWKIPVVEGDGDACAI